MYSTDELMKITNKSRQYLLRTTAKLCVGKKIGRMTFFTEDEKNKVLGYYKTTIPEKHDPLEKDEVIKIYGYGPYKINQVSAILGLNNSTIRYRRQCLRVGDYTSPRRVKHSWKDICKIRDFKG